MKRLESPAMAPLSMELLIWILDLPQSALAHETDLGAFAVGHASLIARLDDGRAQGPAQPREQLRVVGLVVALPVRAQSLHGQAGAPLDGRETKHDVVPAELERAHERPQRGAGRPLAPRLERWSVDTPRAALLDEAHGAAGIDLELDMARTGRDLGAELLPERLRVGAALLELRAERRERHARPVRGRRQRVGRVVVLAFERGAEGPHRLAGTRRPPRARAERDGADARDDRESTSGGGRARRPPAVHFPTATA